MDIKPLYEGECVKNKIKFFITAENILADRKKRLT